MRNTKIALATVAAVALFAGSASAQNYVSGSIGTNLGRADIGSADIDQYGLAVGRDFGPTRVELAYNKLADVEGTTAKADNVLLNGYLEPVSFGNLTPYVGVGVGYTWLEARPFKDEGFTTSVAAGAEFKVTERLSLQGEWRRFNFAQDVDTSVASIGARYTF